MRLKQSFYDRPVLTVAKDLLGKFLVAGRCVGMITETEAYRAKDDPACHGFRGKTDRNCVIFGKPGLLYVYFTYGMHFCMNVVTGHEDVGEAVLIRAVQPIEGVSLMKRRRGSHVAEKNLTNGPGKVCQAFGIGREENGIDLVTNKFIYIEDRGIIVKKSQIEVTPRIGIRVGTDKLWRFIYNLEARNPKSET